MTIKPNKKELKKTAEHEKPSDAVAITERRRSAYPILPVGTPVRADITGWRFWVAHVVSDPGPHRSGDRKIRIRKITRRDEEIQLRRDRVSVVPTE